MDHNEKKPVSRKYKPRVPCSSAISKDHTDEQFGKFLKLLTKLHINLPFIEALWQMPNAVKFLKELLANKRKFDEASHEIRSKNIHEPCSSNNKGPIYEEGRLQIEELDECCAHKPRTHDKPKPRHDRLNVSPNKLKVGDKVLLDAPDSRITTSEPNRAIPFTVLNIFPYGTVKVTHSEFSTFKILRGRPLGVGYCIDWTAIEQTQLADAVRALLTADPWGFFFEIVEPTYLELTLELCSTFHLQSVMTKFDDHRMVQFRLSGLVRQLSMPEFGVALGLYTKEFMDDDNFNSLHRYIHYSPSNCWKALVPASATYDPSRSKASALAPSLRYLHAILAQHPDRMAREHRNLQLHGKRSSTTAMSCSTTTITSSLDTVVVRPNLYHHWSSLLQSHPCLSRLLSDVPTGHL
ncbi:hypothetical protein GOBAR_AA36083 [Gossypium barbadense]|uniref:Uncharacterized protein n=1 Tax=Gossypium barbadense TaxID=3634 RepID=A0A2P5W0M3_GOSBA|nr:hypothetical protein GOBAR_AA36083 [Gossypium barbadense]